jgi:hypothetical protein
VKKSSFRIDLCLITRLFPNTGLTKTTNPHFLKNLKFSFKDIENMIYDVKLCVDFKKVVIFKIGQKDDELDSFDGISYTLV